MRNLPAHHEHQAESKKEENQCRDAVLNPDDFVIDGKDAAAPEALIRVMLFMDSAMWNCVCRLHDIFTILAQHLLPNHRQQQVSELDHVRRVNGGFSFA